MYPYHHPAQILNPNSSSDHAVWAAAIGALLLFGITTFQVVKTLLDERRSKVAFQAERTSAWIADETGGGENAWVALLNSSNEPVYQVIASVVRLQKGHRDGDARSTSNNFRTYADTLPPGTYYAKIDGGYGGGSFHPSVEIAFIDKFGTSWVRNGDGWLHQIDVKPHEHYGLSEPLPWELARSALADFPEYNSDTE
jgi:hypothetical protein